MKYNYVTIIFTMNVYIWKLPLFVFERQEIDVCGWCYLSMLLGEWDSCCRGLSSRKHFFFYSLEFGIDIVTLLISTPKKSIFIEGSSGNKHFRLANQSMIISYNSTTFWLVSLSNAPIFVCGKISLPRIRFWLVPQSKHLIRAWLIKDPSPWLSEWVGGVSGHFNQNKNQRWDLFTPRDREIMFKKGSIHR